MTSRHACLAINARGDIVGEYRDSQHRHGFLLSGGIYTTIQDPNGLAGGAFGINDREDIVGDYFDGTANYGFVLSKG